MATPTTIARYEILNRIGRGGMGSLYLAKDPKIDRLVAIKLLNADLERDDMRIRFDREARSAGALNHPNIVTIFDYGVFDDQPYIVMEYLRGETLAELIRRKAPLPLRDKLSLLEQLCRGLSYAHDAGIIHRDIKPANLMIDQHGVLKILDFGIARLAESGLTQMSVTVGTPGYMSPEQIDGRHIDRASDVFSVGAVAYELLTYRPAFGGDSQHAIIYSVLHSEPEPILTVAPDLAPDVAAIVDKALQKTTAARYEDAVAMQQDLQTAREALGGTRRTPLRVTPSRLTPTPKPSLPGEVPTALTPRPTPGLGNITPGANLIERAKQAMAAGESAKALELVNRILANDPQQAEALTIQHKIDDPRVDDLLSKARAGLLGQRLTEASEYVSRALKIRPDSEAALKLQAELDSHRTDVEKKVGGRARAKAAVDRGRKYIAEGAWDAARRAADEAWALDPDNQDAVELIAAADAGQRGVGIPYPPGDPLSGPTAPMTVVPTISPSGTVSTSASAAGSQTAAVSPTARVTGSVPDSYAGVSADGAPKRGIGMWVLAGAGAIAVGVTAFVLWGGSGKPAAPAKDLVQPIVQFQGLTDGQTVSGVQGIRIAASDNVGVTSVRVKVDDNLIQEVLHAPYEATWGSTQWPDGTHTISADAVDAAGNHAIASIKVVTNNAVQQTADNSRGAASGTRSGGTAAAPPPVDPKLAAKTLKESALKEAGALAKELKYIDAEAKILQALKNPLLTTDGELKDALNDYKGPADLQRKKGGG